MINNLGTLSSELQINFDVLQIETENSATEPTAKNVVFQFISGNSKKWKSMKILISKIWPKYSTFPSIQWAADGPVDSALNSRLAKWNTAMYANGTWCMSNPSWVQCPPCSHTKLYLWGYQTGRTISSVAVKIVMACLWIFLKVNADGSSELGVVGGRGQ